MADNDDAKKKQQAEQESQDAIQSAYGRASQAAQNGGTYMTGVFSTNGTVEFDAGRDILTGADFKKYEHPERLVGTQMQYANTGNIRVVNFKQDYVVLIRKKLFYAANSAGNIEKDNAEMSDGNYVRTYKLDNWTSIRTNISISGTPGNCQIDLQGGEWVLCYEETSLTNRGKPIVTSEYNGYVSDEFPNNNAQLQNDSSNNFENTQTQQNDPSTQVEHGVATVNDAIANNIWNRSGVHPYLEQYRGITYDTKANPDGKTGTVTMTDTDGTVRKFTLPMDNTKRDENILNIGQNCESGYKIAEKCDWEPMDEVWIYGKSNFERDSKYSNSDFKMNQIFFGYIDNVTKTYLSGKSAGCTISITATDQLKLLDLSYVTMNPSMTPGASGVGGIDLRYSKQDTSHFGTFRLYNPYSVMQQMGLFGSAEDAKKAQEETLNNSWEFQTLANIFGGKPIAEIIKQLCLDAGVPTWYLKQRIEPIQYPPFVYSYKQSNSSMLFNGSMMKRLNECQTAARKLLLEFFADEAGNIVLKCPNFALGVNSKVKNNMGFAESCSAMMNIDIDNIQPYYAINETKIDNAKLQHASQEDLDILNNTSHSTNVDQCNQYKRVKAAEEIVKGSNLTMAEAADKLSGLTETNPQYTFMKQYTTYTDDYGSGDNGPISVSVQAPDTFVSLAERYLGKNSDAYLDIYDQACSQFNTDGKQIIKDINDCQAIYGQTLIIRRNRLYDNQNKTWLGNSDQLRDDLITKYGEDESTWYKQAEAEDKKQVQKRKETQEKYMQQVQKQYSGTLSEMTDSLIPEIPQEFILSFSLTDSDKQIYNMYEVNIEGDFGIFDKGGPLQKICRVFPDIASMIRFGCRPNPTVYNFPYMGNKENAHLLGFMLCAMSLARRNSATLSMIEDSSIHVGDPIRFFAYDEHPDVPLSEQKGDRGQFESVLNSMARTSKDLETQTMETLSGFEQFAVEKEQEKVEGGNYTPYREKDTGNYVGHIDKGNALNIMTETDVSKKSYEKVPASQMATHTDAQTIYYVEQVSRSIGVAKESTMTLTLSCGRMMGHPSVIDYMLLLYQAYFDPALGFCPDIAELNKLRDKYKGNTKEHKITPLDCLIQIAYDEYHVLQNETAVPDIAVNTAQEMESLPESKYSLDKLAGDGASEVQCVGLKNFFAAENLNLGQFQPLFADVKQYNGDWKKLTSMIYGHVSCPNPRDPQMDIIKFSFVIFLFDYNQTRWAFSRTEGGGTVNKGYSFETHYRSENEAKSEYNVLAGVRARWIAGEYNKTNNVTSYKEMLNAVINMLKKEAMSVGDRSEYRATANECVFKDNEINPSMKNVTEGSQESSIAQQKIEELHHAIIALNVDKFGSSLTINMIQFDGILNRHIGETIIIPKEIILGEKSTDKANKKDEPDSKTEVAANDAEKQAFGNDVKKYQVVENGVHCIRYESSTCKAQYYFKEDGWDNSTTPPDISKCEKSFVKIKEADGYHLIQSQSCIDGRSRNTTVKVDTLMTDDTYSTVKDNAPDVVSVYAADGHPIIENVEMVSGTIQGEHNDIVANAKGNGSCKPYTDMVYNYKGSTQKDGADFMNQTNKWRHANNIVAEDELTYKQIQNGKTIDSTTYQVNSDGKMENVTTKPVEFSTNEKNNNAKTYSNSNVQNNNSSNQKQMTPEEYEKYTYNKYKRFGEEKAKQQAKLARQNYEKFYNSKNQNGNSTTRLNTDKATSSDKKDYKKQSESVLDELTKSNPNSMSDEQLNEKETKQTSTKPEAVPTSGKNNNPKNDNSKNTTSSENTQTVSTVKSSIPDNTTGTDIWDNKKSNNDLSNKVQSPMYKCTANYEGLNSAQLRAVRGQNTTSSRVIKADINDDGSTVVTKIDRNMRVTKVRFDSDGKYAGEVKMDSQKYYNATTGEMTDVQTRNATIAQVAGEYGLSYTGAVILAPDMNTKKQVLTELRNKGVHCDVVISRR